jgi:hypothetical protein
MPVSKSKHSRSTSKTKQSPPYTGRPLDLRDESSHADRLDKTDSQSDLTTALQNLVNNKPDPLETSAPVIQKWINNGWLFFRRGQHEAFLVAWHVGEVLSAVRKDCPNGHKKNRTKPTWPEWVGKFTPFDCVETANRWADIWEVVKPENTANFDAMTIESARELVKFLKGEKARVAKRIEKADAQASDADASSDPKPNPDKKDPPPVGNVVNSIRVATGKLAASLEFHDAHSSHQSPLRDADKLTSWIADGLLSASEILSGIEFLNKQRKALLGSRHKTTVEGARILREMHKHFAKARAEFERLVPSEEVA